MRRDLKSCRALGASGGELCVITRCSTSPPSGFGATIDISFPSAMTAMLARTAFTGSVARPSGWKASNRTPEEAIAYVLDLWDKSQEAEL